MRLPDRTFRAALALALLVVVAGCGADKPTKPIITPALPPGTPAANAPDSTTIRWLTAYAVRVEDVASGVLTSDFRYHFSAQSDPLLVEVYGDNWGKVDEGAALHHMRTGFTNTGGTYVPPVTSTTFSLADSVVLDDTHADSAAWYQRLDGVVSLIMNVSSSGGTVTYNMTTPFHAYLVRGDAAVLAAGQSPSAALWYLRRLDDLTPAVALAGRKVPVTASPAGAKASSWGSVRALYR